MTDLSNIVDKITVDDIIVLIFSYIDSKNLPNIAATCKRFYKIYIKIIMKEKEIWTEYISSIKRNIKEQQLNTHQVNIFILFLKNVEDLLKTWDSMFTIQQRQIYYKSIRDYITLIYPSNLQTRMNDISSTILHWNKERKNIITSKREITRELEIRFKGEGILKELNIYLSS
jgi:hypothetical protein